MRKQIYRVSAALAVVFLVASALWAGGHTPFEVVSTVPTDGERGVALDQVLTATFSQDLDCSTIQSPATTFTLTTGTGHHGVAVAGTVTCLDAVATFTPSSALIANTDYTARISDKVKDDEAHEKRLESDFVWSFKTGAGAVAPTVTAVTPPNGATGVALNTKVTAEFDQAMNPASINTSTFTLTFGRHNTSVRGTITYDATDNIATFTPNAPLQSNTLYTATIKACTTRDGMLVISPDCGCSSPPVPPMTCLSNPQGTGLASSFVWTFTTGVVADVIPPTVISTIPGNGATGVPQNQIVTATFSESMLGSTITTTPPQFTLEDLNTSTFVTNYPGVVTYTLVGTTATFTPGALLVSGHTYQATIETGVTDLAGNHLVSNYVWTFTIGSGVSSTPPTVLSTNPINSGTVCTNGAINATFSEAMDFGTFNSGTFYVIGPSPITTPPVAGTLSIDVTGTIVTFTPTLPLTSGGSYQATITTGVTDLFNNPLGSNHVWSFTVSGTCLAAVPLNAAEPFAVLSGVYGVTNTGLTTVITGNLGTTATAYSALTGFHDLTVLPYVAPTNGCTYTETGANVGLVTGKIVSPLTPSNGTCTSEGTAATASAASTAWNDALTAWNTLMGLPGLSEAQQLGAATVYPGVYYNTAGFLITGTGDLTLDAQGNANAVWVFQMPSTTLTVGLTGGPCRNVILANGAQAKNVFWAVGSYAYINSYSGCTMVGTIIASSGIAFSTASYTTPTVLDGRAIGLYGSVTMVDTVITVPLP